MGIINDIQARHASLKDHPTLTSKHLTIYRINALVKEVHTGMNKVHAVQCTRWKTSVHFSCFFCSVKPSVQYVEMLSQTLTWEGKRRARAVSCGESCLLRDHETNIDNNEHSI